MGMTMGGLNPNGFPQPQSIAPAPAMGIMAMMAAAQPPSLAGANNLPMGVDTVPSGPSLEAGGGRRRAESSSPSVSLINIGGAAVACLAASMTASAASNAMMTASSKLSNETQGTATGQAQQSVFEFSKDVSVSNQSIIQNMNILFIGRILTLNDPGFWEEFFWRNEVCLVKFSFK